MSKRRGNILVDEESIERRNWYSGLQRNKLEEVAKEKVFYQNERQRELAQFSSADAVHREKSLKHNINSWIVSLNEVKSHTATVVCFHGFGQSHGFFKRWQKQLGAAGVQLCGVCLPGRANRAPEDPFISVRDAAITIFLAMKAMDMLTRRDPDAPESLPYSPPPTVRPLVLFGHNVGALLAYEVAKLLQDYHYHHAALIVSGAPSPYQQGQNRFGKKMCFLSDAELLKHMIELGGVPEALLKRTDVLKYFIPLFRSDYYLYDKYIITPPVNVLAIPESDLENAIGALHPPPEGKPLHRKIETPTKGISRGHSFLSEMDPQQEEVEQEELVYPVVLYRLHCEIVSLRVEDDPFVSEEEVAEWTHMSNTYDNITLDSVGAGGHLNSLCEHEQQILNVVKRCCNILD